MTDTRSASSPSTDEPTSLLGAASPEDDPYWSPPGALDWLIREFRDNPASMLTVSYVFLSAVGFLYYMAFFANLRINILKYAALSDFLLAAVREPLVVLLAVLPIPLGIAYNRVTTAVMRRVRKARTATERQRRMRAWVPLMNVLAFVLWATLFLLKYADWSTDQLRAGRWPADVVEYAPDGTGSPPRADSVNVVGTAGSFTVFWYSNERRVHLVPTDRIAAILTREVRRVP